MTAGFTVLTAQKFGAGDIKAMRQTVGGAAVLSILVTIVLNNGRKHAVHEAAFALYAYSGGYF